MIIFRSKSFSIYSIGREDEIKINCSGGMLSLKRSGLDEIKTIFNNSKLLDKKPTDKNGEEDTRPVNKENRVLVYDVFLGDNKLGVVQLSENSAVEVELDWINLNDTTGEYFIGLLEYFINLARSCRYRVFILGLYRCSDEIENKCLDYYGFVSSTDGEIKGVTLLYRPL